MKSGRIAPAGFRVVRVQLASRAKSVATARSVGNYGGWPMVYSLVASARFGFGILEPNNDSVYLVLQELCLSVHDNFRWLRYEPKGNWKPSLREWGCDVEWLRVRLFGTCLPPITSSAGMYSPVTLSMLKRLFLIGLFIVVLVNYLLIRGWEWVRYRKNKKSLLVLGLVL